MGSLLKDRYTLAKTHSSPIHILYYLAIFTSSFDIFLVVNIGGLNFRITQFLLIIPITITFLTLFLSFKRAIFPIGFKWLIIWSVFILIFIPNTTFLQNSIGYACWLLFNILIVFLTLQLFQTYTQLIKLIRWYIYSFFFVSLFGLLQFTLGLLHLGAPLITQWWLPGLLPRINGFSYEPSFFTTYIIMGWIICVYLIKTNTIFLISLWKLKFIFYLQTLVIILSSSRIGILMMVIWYLQYPFSFLFHLIQGKLRVKALQYSLLLSIIILISGTLVSIIGFDNINFLLSGTGLTNTSAHSVTERQNGATKTWEVFIQSPLIGHSLGGVPIAIGYLDGIDVNNMELVKEYTGISVFLEVLAASGFVGFIPFLFYIITLIFLPLKLTKQLTSKEDHNLLLALETAFIFELIILQFGQNILRPYVWFQIAILSTTYHVLKNKNLRHI